MDPEIIKRMLAMKVGIRNDPKMVTQYTDKSFLLCEHEAGINYTKELPADNTILGNFAQTQLESPGLRSSVPVQLTPANGVDILTLALNTDKVLDGKYFLCRTLTPPIKMTAIITIVEDPRGQQGVRLALHNYSTSNSRNPEALLQDLPVGQILAIKNPWFKSALDGGFELRCDNPLEVLVVSELMAQKLFPGVKWEGEIPIKWHKFIKSSPQSAIEWKNEGNKLFVAQKYQKAIQCYTDGLNLKDVASAGSDAQVTVTCDMLSNRAAAYLNLNCFQNALGDVNKLLEIDPNHIKGLYRKGKALLGLQRFEEAVTFLKAVGNLKNLDARNQKLVTELLKLADILLKQQRTGDYDILKLNNEGTIRHNDCADFAGPVSVQKIDGRGRGLVATKDIEPGQLISATRAFVVVFPEQLGQGQPGEVNFGTKLMNKMSQRILVQEIAQKLTLEPSLCREVYQLYTGPDFPIYDESLETGNGAHVVDMKRIDAICNFNSFSGSTSKETVKIVHESKDGTSSGLWIFPSFLNHSCWDCNALWTIYGDMLFVRAFKKIHQGEEILISYLNPSAVYEDREKFLKNHGFVCECRLCRIDRDDSAEGRKRAKLLGKLDKYWKNKDGKKHDGEQQYVDFMMTCFQNIWDLDKEGQNQNLKIYPSLVFPMRVLSHYYFNPVRRDFRKSVNLMTKCYDMTINSPLKEFTVDACVSLIAANLMDENFEEVATVAKLAETLKKEILILYGTLDMAKNVLSNNTLDFLEQLNITF